AFMSCVLLVCGFERGILAHSVAGCRRGSREIPPKCSQAYNWHSWRSNSGLASRILWRIAVEMRPESLDASKINLIKPRKQTSALQQVEVIAAGAGFELRGRSVHEWFIESWPPGADCRWRPGPGHQWRDLCRNNRSAQLRPGSHRLHGR